MAMFTTTTDTISEQDAIISACEMSATAEQSVEDMILFMEENINAFYADECPMMLNLEEGEEPEFDEKLFLELCDWVEVEYALFEAIVCFEEEL